MENQQIDFTDQMKRKTENAEKHTSKIRKKLHSLHVCRENKVKETVWKYQPGRYIPQDLPQRELQHPFTDLRTGQKSTKRNMKETHAFL